MLKLPSDWVYNDTYNYTEVFALTFLYNIAIITTGILAIFIVLLIVKLCLARRKANDVLKESILTVEESSRASVSEGAERPLVRMQPQPESKAFKFFSFLTSFFFYCFWIAASLIYLNFYMFGYFGRGSANDVLSAFAVFLIVAIPTLIWKHITKRISWENMQKEAVALIILLVLWLAVSVFLVVLTKGGCVCFFNNKYGIKIDDDVEISTEFTRINSIGVPCPEKEVCHLYATVPEDASTAVFFNAHAGMSIESLNFTLKLNNTILSSKNVSSMFTMDNVQSIGQRKIYSVLFTGLSQNTTYKLQVIDKSGITIKWANYKTVPGVDAAQLRMAVGGDIGMSESGDKITNYLIDFNPDIIILGGDIAYDDAMRTCYYSWDTVYSMFEPTYKGLDRLVPIIFTVGNHDVGYDALTSNSIGTAAADLPLFFVFNPQHLAHNQEAVPGVFQRETLHYHKIGPSIHFILDSGYLRTYKEQINFMQLYSLNNSNLYRFANYHNPIYPACTNSNPGSNDRIVIENGLKYWTPVFDNLSFAAAMEHHTHFRKITYKIKDNVPTNETGTRYVGDGSWGVTQFKCPDIKLPPRPEIMQDYVRENPNHIWQIKMTRKNTTTRQYSINYKAVNLQNVTVFQVMEDLPELQ